MVKAINSALLAFAVAAVSVNALTGHQPHFNGLNHRDLAGHRHAVNNLEKRDLGKRIDLSLDPFSNTNTASTGPTGGGDGGNGPTGGGSGGAGGSTTTPTTLPPTTSNTPTTTDQPPTTSDTSTSTSTTPTSTSSTPTSTSSTPNTSTTAQGSTILRANTGVSYTNTAALTSLRAATTSSSTDDAAAPAQTDTPFLKNKTAVAATFTVVSIVGIGIIIFVVIWLRKKQQRGKMMEEDMWDEAGMQELSRPQTDITPPAPAVLPSGGLGRKNTVLPSQSAGAARPARSVSPDPYGEEPDEILAVPPVVNYDRPRDSAFDIVPAAPPAAAQYGGSMQPPRRGDHTSFGSGLGVDPFAGTGFVDATRDSTFGGPGQAGRGAGYNMGPYDQPNGGAGAVQMGNQWPQGYNPYNGYHQGGEDAYANYGNYGAHGYAH